MTEVEFLKRWDEINKGHSRYKIASAGLLCRRFLEGRINAFDNIEHYLSNRIVSHIGIDNSLILNIPTKRMFDRYFKSMPVMAKIMGIDFKYYIKEEIFKKL